MGLNHEVKAERSDPATPHHPVVTACRPMAKPLASPWRPRLPPAAPILYPRG